MTRIPLGRLVELRTTKAVDTSGFRVGLEHVEGGTGRLLHGEADYSGDGVQFEPGDVLFGKLRPYLAKVWHADRAGSAVGDFHVYRPRTTAIDSRYLQYVLLADSFLGPVVSSVYGAKMPRASWEFIRTVEVETPSVRVQRAIADHLDRETAQIDTLIAKQEQLISTLRERRRAEISSRIFPVGESVPTHALKRTLARNDGGAWGDEPDGVDDTIVLRSTELSPQGQWKIVDPARRKLSTSTAAETRLLEGDLVVAKSSGSPTHVGKAGLVDQVVADFTPSFGNFMQRLRFKNAFDPRFHWYAFQADHVRDQIQLLSTTTTGLANLTGTQIGTLEVPFPPISRQRLIVENLDVNVRQLDKLIHRAERFIALSKERRAALITAAVTGQLEIPISA